jgi:hypothetical protein
VEDDHVDRPGVEVRQRMKLTGTNSSIGLIVLIACAHLRATAKRLSRQSEGESLCDGPGEHAVFVRFVAPKTCLKMQPSGCASFSIVALR